MDFSARHIGPSPAEQEQMLAAVGYSSLDDLTAAALPPALAGTGASPLSLPGAHSRRRRRRPSCAGWRAGTRWRRP